MKPKKKLTPYQQMEIQIRETERVEKEQGEGRIVTPRSGDESRGDLISPERVRKAGLTEASQPGAGPTDDELAPENLIHEDGALSPSEVGEDFPADRSYRIVNADEVGVGYGLDEAELAHVDPLDGEPWDDEEGMDEDEDDNDEDELR